jgi:hypothetical protein
MGWIAVGMGRFVGAEAGEGEAFNTEGTGETEEFLRLVAPSFSGSVFSSISFVFF